MLKSLQQIVVNAVVVRGDTVIGHVEKIEIDEGGVYIVLECLTDDEPPKEEQDNPVRAEIARIGR